MPLQLVIPPAGEPVTLLEAKQHLRVDVDDDDALIGSLIAAARQAAETITGRQLMTARWKLVLDAFPGATFAHAGTGATFSLPAHAVLLAKCPVQSVISIEYLDMNGTLQTMHAEDYVLDAACEPARLSPAFGKSWPPTLPHIEAIAGAFDAGYGLASAVPEGIKSWIKLRVGSLYGHREEVSVLTRGRIDPLPFVDGLLDGYRVSLV